ncbi:hypothetical protein [Ornithinimicrobium kibberense]|uniref:hypothetical protein n=1 Tax=Ornithinimicrobium kibberense TaxID=282060 RepID=UPI00360AAF3B
MPAHHRQDRGPQPVEAAGGGHHVHAQQPAEGPGVDEVREQEGGDDQVGPDQVCRARAPAHQQRRADEKGHERQGAQGDERGIPVRFQDGARDEHGLGHQGGDDEGEHGRRGLSGR